VELRRRRCRSCRATFGICGPCDRGTRYCSGGCALAGRRASTSAARARHRASEEGRADHRDAEQARRARRRDFPVADQCSVKLTAQALVFAHEERTPDITSLAIETSFGERRKCELHLSYRLGFKRLKERRASARAPFHIGLQGRAGPRRCIACGRQGWIAVVRAVDQRTRRSGRATLPFRPTRSARGASP
jgi:hypothetical protein